MLMNPNLAPPAPPPMQPVTPAHNPYDFITQPTQPPKKKLLPNGSKKARLLIVLFGLFLLGLVAIIIMSLLNSGAKGARSDYVSLLQQQTELIRVSNIGITKARQAETKNLAITTNYSLTSEQAALIQLAKKTGAKTDIATLGLGKNTQTDSLLNSASQTNQFDSVFVTTLQAGLKKYQATLKKIYDESGSKASKAILTKDYDNASVLIGNQKQ